MKNILILLILITLTGCQNMDNQNQSTINSEKTKINIIIEENKIYELEFEFDGNGNWRPIIYPLILWNKESNTTRVVKLQWENIDDFSELNNSKNGDTKKIIFKVIKIYTAHEFMRDVPDILSPEAICKIIDVK